MKKKIFDKEILLYCIGKNMTFKDMAKHLGCSVDTVKNNLAYQGIVYKPASWKKGRELNALRQHPEINKQWLITHWINTTKSIKELSIEFGVSDSLLEYRASYYNLKKPRKQKINVDKLFDLNDPHIWYIAGLVATDGYLPKHTDCIVLELVGDDEFKLLLNICNYYEMTMRPTYHKQSNSNYIRLSALSIKKFFKDNFNITSEDKTHTVTTPNSFPDKLCAIAYLRGCIDGDGCIEFNRHRLRLVTASEDFIQGLIKTFVEYMDITPKYFITERGDREYPGLIINKTADFEKLIKSNDELIDCFKLERKWKK